MVSAKIAVDCDDTLYSFTNLAKQLMANWDGTEEERRVAKNAAYTPWTQWRSMSDLCPFYEEVIDATHEPDRIKANVPFEGASEVLHDLSKAGHRIVYITNRNPNRHGPTFEWLEDNDFPIGSEDDLVCTLGNKMPFIEDCQFIIDDRPKTLVSFVFDDQWDNHHPTKPRKGFGLMTQANQSLTDIPGVYLSPTWDLLRHYFKEKAELL